MKAIINFINKLNLHIICFKKNIYLPAMIVSRS